MCRSHISFISRYNSCDGCSGRDEESSTADTLRRWYDEEVFGLTEERGVASGTDPTELWRQWLESGTRMWSGATGGTQDNYLDPTGVYRQWFEGMRELQERMGGVLPAATTALGGGAGVQQVWQRWFEAAGESWRRGAGLSQNAMEVLPRWTQMLEEARDNLLAAGAPPSDPLQLATQWYNATNGPFSDFVGDLIEREEYLEPSSRYLQSYASFYKVFKRNSEEYLKNLQLPVRSDVTRIASLVVNLEDKVDNIEEVLEDFEFGYATPATAESVQDLERRLVRVEGKLDRLLAALESSGQNGGAQAAQTPADANGSAGGEVVDATDAAQRKARELGVDLTTVEGTGTDGRITVDDVRKKGES
jgi:polyhydroxyalkanoic acid synthase PhaR subunit